MTLYVASLLLITCIAAHMACPLELKHSIFSLLAMCKWLITYYCEINGYNTAVFFAWCLQCPSLLWSFPSRILLVMCHIKKLKSIIDNFKLVISYELSVIYALLRGTHTHTCTCTHTTTYWAKAIRVKQLAIIVDFVVHS